MSDQDEPQVVDQSTSSSSGGWLTTRRRIGIAVGALAVVAIGLIALNQAVKSKKTEDVTVVDPASSIEITVDSGRVTLTDGASLTISRTSRYVFKKPSVDNVVKDGVLRLKGDCSGLRIGGCSTDYTLAVPSGVAVKVKNNGGVVELDGLKSDTVVSGNRADVEIKSTYGKVDVTTTSGSIKGSAISSREVVTTSEHGAIELKFAATPTTVSATSAEGDVTVQVPKTSTSYKVDASSESGKTITDIARDNNSPYAVVAKSEGGDVTVEAK